MKTYICTARLNGQLIQNEVTCAGNQNDARRQFEMMYAGQKLSNVNAKVK